MFAADNAPWGDHDPYAALDATVSVVDGVQARVHAAVCHVSGCEDLGRGRPGQSKDKRDFCCTPSLQQAGVCHSVGDIIRLSFADGPLDSAALPSAGGGLAAALNVSEPVLSTGYRAVLLVCCSTTESVEDGTVCTLSGEGVFKNPYGYLPGRLVAVLVAYPALVMLYVLLLVVFLVAYCRHYHQRTPLQSVLLFVIPWGVVDVLLRLAMYAEMNRTGKAPCCPLQPVAGMLLVTDAVLRTVLQGALLLVSNGLGVVSLSLPRPSCVLTAVLCTSYLATSLWADFSELKHPSEPNEVAPEVFRLVANIAIISTAYLLLSSTVKHLEASRQHAKLAMYRQFTQLLLVVVTLWLVAESLRLLVFTGTIAFPFRLVGLFAAVSPSLYLVAIGGACYIWAPSALSRSYAQHQQLGDEDGVQMGEGHPLDDAGDGGGEGGAYGAANGYRASREARPQTTGDAVVEPGSGLRPVQHLHEDDEEDDSADFADAHVERALASASSLPPV